MPTRALLLVLAGVAVLVALFLVLRPDDDTAAEPPPPAASETATEETETETEPAGTEPPDDPPPPPPPAPEEDETFRIAFRGGNVFGDRRDMRVRRGERVRLVVRSDVADHVHVHGYDIMRDVAPGRPAQFSFEATLTGRFEIELEDRGLQIAELEVRP